MIFHGRRHDDLHVRTAPQSRSLASLFDATPDPSRGTASRSSHRTSRAPASGTFASGESIARRSACPPGATSRTRVHGFNDLSHFSRAFRQRFEMSPRAYRVEGGAVRVT
ncbi:AraC family transcriptional regulator [Variovorax humicola]|uniref:AraC family transcriptional regulator n=1 Tax=Variovorax humicola TaxID=1769758 RepID=A0ABU8W737_9BURK